MKQICAFLVIILLTSCEYFNVKKTSSEAILNEELETFNWNDVDEYPSFSSCDSVSSKQEKKQCFTDILTGHIFEYLQDEIIIVTQDINDTIDLKLQISNTGEITLLESDVDSLTVKEIPNINDLLVRSLDTLPKIFPAIKRGQQVTTEFKLPIIIGVD
ncbi:hypothetical protein [Flavivirga algicola]|uniref:Gliding motility-associated protein GldM C-terminal domain-containing protein n=1 Tax=Flavivirga algicola TaxID=2729136 RepID=A0ABX1RWS3_9FLAO|nr:hypothetical protein [Flavivirga algicola]NMH87208.1 hypothetical protein [Flavivirga algicola]